MFATQDRENLINAHQQAAASKPLNQSVRGLGTKTPGAKTPFRGLGNENATVLAGKSVLQTKGKGNENTLQLKGKDAKQQFATPAGKDTTSTHAASRSSNWFGSNMLTFNRQVPEAAPLWG
jgi:hypothetical protein